MMDEMMRRQYGGAQTAYARRQRGNALPPADMPQTMPEDMPEGMSKGMPMQVWMLHGPGQMAPRQHVNFEPVGGGAWRIYPPGRQAPSHAPQGTMPSMPTSYEQVRSLGEDLDRRFGRRGAPRDGME